MILKVTLEHYLIRDRDLGGHTAEMMQLVKSLDPIKFTPRIYISASTDSLSKDKATAFEQSLNKVVQEIKE